MYIGERFPTERKSRISMGYTPRTLSVFWILFHLVNLHIHSLSTRFCFSKQILKNGEESATKQTPLKTKPKNSLNIDGFIRLFLTAHLLAQCDKFGEWMIGVETLFNSTRHFYLGFLCGNLRLWQDTLRLDFDCAVDFSPAFPSRAMFFFERYDCGDLRRSPSTHRSFLNTTVVSCRK